MMPRAPQAVEHEEQEDGERQHPAQVAEQRRLCRRQQPEVAADAVERQEQKAQGIGQDEGQAALIQGPIEGRFAQPAQLIRNGRGIVP